MYIWKICTYIFDLYEKGKYGKDKYQKETYKIEKRDV